MVFTGCLRNSYSYVNGDPVNFRDATGLNPCPDADHATFVDTGDNGACGDTSIAVRPCVSVSVFGFVSLTICPFDSGGGVVVRPKDPDPPKCPLVAPTGSFRLDPNSQNSIHAIFAPDMAAALSTAFASLNSQGIVPMRTSGFRTVAENDSQRNSPNGNSRVSNHLVGEAIDINTRDGNFEKIKAALVGAGLTWGGTFSHPDRPHFQLPAAGTQPSPAQIEACSIEHPGGQ
jgi:hypothetical protein